MERFYERLLLGVGRRLQHRQAGLLANCIAKRADRIPTVGDDRHGGSAKRGDNPSRYRVRDAEENQSEGNPEGPAITWLAVDDATVRSTLSIEWRRPLQDYVPEPFRHLA